MADDHRRCSADPPGQSWRRSINQAPYATLELSRWCRARRGISTNTSRRWATLCISDSVSYFISDRFNVWPKFCSRVMRISNVPPAFRLTREFGLHRFIIVSDRFRNVQSLCAGYGPYISSPPSPPPSLCPWICQKSTGLGPLCRKKQNTRQSKWPALYGARTAH